MSLAEYAESQDIVPVSHEPSRTAQDDAAARHRGGQPPVSLLMRGRFVVTVACLMLTCRLASAQGLAIAAASDMQSALPALAAQFEKDTGQRVADVRLVREPSRRSRTGAPSTCFGGHDYPETP
jgi:hypothetical protein